MSIVWVTYGGSSIAILEYLALAKETGEWRAVAWESSVAVERLSDMEAVWEMTRAAWSQHGGRQYAHTSISLDPGDPRALTMSDQDLLDYARAWAERCIPEGSDWIAVVHRDEPQPHVHIVWGTTNADTGRKWRQTRKWLRDAIAVKDDLDRAYGLRVTPLRQPEARLHRGAARVLERGGYVWTIDLQARVDRAREAAASWGDFEARLAAEGVGMRHTRHGTEARVAYHFVDEQGKQRSASEGKLGGLYERQRIERAIAERSREAAAGGARAAAPGGRRGLAAAAGTDRDRAAAPAREAGRAVAGRGESRSHEGRAARDRAGRGAEAAGLHDGRRANQAARSGAAKLRALEVDREELEARPPVRAGRPRDLVGGGQGAGGSGRGRGGSAADAAAGFAGAGAGGRGGRGGAEGIPGEALRGDGPDRAAADRARERDRIRAGRRAMDARRRGAVERAVADARAATDAIDAATERVRGVVRAANERRLERERQSKKTRPIKPEPTIPLW